MYKLPFELKTIQSPLVLIFPGGKEEMVYKPDKLYDKQYLIESIRAQGSVIYIKLKENDRLNNLFWVGEEAVSFME